MSDVNLIPKKEAITYLERETPGDSTETELTGSLIKLIEHGLIDAGYQDGHVAYQAKGDLFKAFLLILSTSSEQEIKTMLPELRKIKEEYKEKNKTPFKMGMVSEPLIESLKSFSDIIAGENESIREYALEKYVNNMDFSEEITVKIVEYFSIQPERGTGVSDIKTDDVLMEIKKLVEEEERKIVEQEVAANQFIELLDKLSSHSVPESKKDSQ